MTVKTLVVGVGNPTRRDDGAGCVVAERVAALNLPGVEVRTTQQLQVELAEDFARFDRVVVVDASVGGDPVELRAVHPSPAQDAPRESRHSSGVSLVRASTPHLEQTTELAQDRRDARPTLADGVASHHLSPALLLALTQRLHGRSPELLLCTVRGEQFDFGNSLSPAVEARVSEAVIQIAACLSAVSSDETT